MITAAQGEVQKVLDQAVADGSESTVFGHDGYGGSTGSADVRYGLAVAVVKSRMGGNLAGQLVEMIRRSVGAN